MPCSLGFSSAAFVSWFYLKSRTNEGCRGPLPEAFPAEKTPCILLHFRQFVRRKYTIRHEGFFFLRRQFLTHQK